jgi:hypothetical protein
MNFYKKLKIFGKKRDLLLKDGTKGKLIELKELHPDYLEALEDFIYAKMSFKARKMVLAEGEEVRGLQVRIRELNELLEDVRQIDRIGEEKEEIDLVQDARGLGTRILKSLVSTKGKKVAKIEPRVYSVADYMASEDFDGKVK